MSLGIHYVICHKTEKQQTIMWRSSAMKRHKISVWKIFVLFKNVTFTCAKYGIYSFLSKRIVHEHKASGAVGANSGPARASAGQVVSR